MNGLIRFDPPQSPDVGKLVCGLSLVAYVGPDELVPLPNALADLDCDRSVGGKHHTPWNDLKEKNYNSI